MSDVGEKGETGKFVAGGMYFVRFGKQRGDPGWVVDISSHKSLMHRRFSDTY